MKRKKELIVILSSLLVIVLSVSVAYFTTKILGTGKDISVTSADLKVIFTSGSGTINGTGIEPGWSSGENTFTVKNESNGTYRYNIIIKDLVNTFTTSGFLVYRITSTDGGYNMSDFADVPKSSEKADTKLAESISIAKGATHTYTVEFKYLESEDVDQSADMGKILTGKIFITKGDEPTTLVSKLLEDNPTISARADFAAPFLDNTQNTLYIATENETDVYYFAGAESADLPMNNWVKFGGFYWRIIRTNADGSVRMLYSGTSPDTTEGYIGKSAFNTSYKSPKYVGYMYGDNDTTLEEARTNTNDSTIKTYIDNWYENNLTAYTNYLSNDAIYCNDRELASGSNYSTTSSDLLFSSYEKLGFVTDNIVTPSYDCTNNKNAFSGSNAEAKLKYPIALMTADEISYAGGLRYDINGSPMWYYMNSTYNFDVNSGISGNQNWWTMTPFIWDVKQTYIIYSDATGTPGIYDGTVVNETLAVRPVTSLKSCVQWKSGDGSAESPYEIVENGGC